MKKIQTLIVLSLLIQCSGLWAQKVIPMDTINWSFRQAQAYVIENFKGKSAVYLQGGMNLKNFRFLNGTIEYDVYLKEEQAFPGVYFRAMGPHGEQFFLRPHLSGKPDANQAAPLLNGITPWQLMFGPKYSFSYKYKFNDWTHVKVVVNGDKAQVFLDGAKKPNLSWNLTMNLEEGEIVFRGGNRSGMHIANVIIDKNAMELVDFSPIKRDPIKGLVPTWVISDKFEEKLLEAPENFKKVIAARKWGRTIEVEEGTAANISRQEIRYNAKPGNTVFAKIEITSNKKQLKLLDFGYSDRVVVILNGKPIYKGTNRWRSRDYRFLGTVGLFDAVYLNLKKGKNTLLMAVSEDFGGWLITGKFKNQEGIKF